MKALPDHCDLSLPISVTLSFPRRLADRARAVPSSLTQFPITCCTRIAIGVSDPTPVALRRRRLWDSGDRDPAAAGLSHRETPLGSIEGDSTPS
ncbi:hypothetical protein PCANC_19272 [Puccinia coronata f. sp. avenae]|uniref:Uncharacterized protein n=1 Tax=Puccinia coronata f. sp. avenae TaxID=200324 RepID=A0A2N5TJM4_9BASI|nr:hypothetical protein PCASD_26432 [Puccinia coronata f. sp. avenae]PLW35186.1 hypothetical protein PCANC_19272 [Puccinia coronata f. sp. avenae]